jgi:UDP-N-acetylmuramoylalanine--D-glutamate ligase
MIEARTFAGKRVAVCGMGISGLAAGRSLLAGGATISVWDDSERRRAAAAAAGLPLADLREADWTKIAALVLAPGVPLTHPEPHWVVRAARAHNVEVIGDTEIFVRERRASGKATKLIAITGTNGKSTTTALSQHLLSSAGLDAIAGGNIGKAILDLPPFADGRHYVIEFSSFQLDLTPSIDPDVAVLLNIAPDHLDRHGTMENYAAVKEGIFRNPGPLATAVIGADDPTCDAIAGRVEAKWAKSLRISSQHPVRNGVYASCGEVFQVTDGVPQNRGGLAGIGSLRGTHNSQNAAAALASGLSLNVPWKKLLEGLEDFPGLPHRMEEVRKIGHILFINDSKATNADAAARALSSFFNIYWIAGGKPKEGGIKALEPLFAHVKKAYLIGEAAPAFAETLAGKVPYCICRTLDLAVAEAAEDALSGDAAEEAVVLLSPACASYDQFPNFEVRGDAFRALVKARPPVAAEKGRAA